MPGRPSPSADSHAYIPPAMEHAMTQQLQSSLPAHLRQYVGQDKPAYIPAHIERELSQQMQKMPAHLRQYSNAYMQQRLVKPGLAGLDPYHQTQLLSRPPTPDKLRLGHSMPVGEQYSVQWGAASPDSPMANGAQPGVQPAGAQPLTPGAPLPIDPSTQQPVAAAQPYNAGPVDPVPPTTPHSPEYEFIMNPNQPTGRPSLPGNKSMPFRVLAIGGGLFALLIVFIILKSLLGGNGIGPDFIAIAQDQQELIHLTSTITQQNNQAATLSTTNQNFAITTQASITSEQTQLLTYLKANHISVSTKLLSLKVSPSLDSQLSAASATSNYDQTFQQISQTLLATYQQDLRRAYAQNKGPVGRQLLNNFYNASALLGKQLNSTPSS